MKYQGKRFWLWGMMATSLVLLAVMSCGKKDSGSSSDDSDDAAESAIGTINSAADDASDGGFAWSDPTRTQMFAGMIEKLLLPKNAWAATCTNTDFPINATCSSSVKTTSPSCTFGPMDKFTLSGTIKLTFSNTSCPSPKNMATNEYVIREVTPMTIVGPRGGTLTNSTASKADYNQVTYGGGTKITKTAGGWTLEVLGMHRTLTGPGATEIFSVSSRTNSPITITGALGRAGRTMNGGELEINHNLAKFTAKHVPSNLTWSAGCCHPSSGTMTVTRSGSVTGTATISFTGCDANGSGNATVTDSSGASKEIKFSSCH